MLIKLVLSWLVKRLNFEKQYRVTQQYYIDMNKSNHITRIVLERNQILQISSIIEIVYSIISSSFTGPIEIEKVFTKHLTW